MHNCATIQKNIAKSAKKSHGSIGIAFDNNYITKGDESSNSLSVVNSEEIIDVFQIISSQLIDDSDSHVSKYESNKRDPTRNYIDDVRI